MASNKKKIQVVSLGVGEMLSSKALLAIESADVVIGAEHHFTMLQQFAPNIGKTKNILFPSPFSDLAELIGAYKNKQIVILASGDALFYGVGQWLLVHLGQETLEFYPNESSMQVAFHRVGIAWQGAVIVSLHGRPLNTLNRYLQKNITLGIFTDEISNPVEIARSLVQQGFGGSMVWVCESLGKQDERISCFIANDLQNKNKKFNALNICVVNCVGHNQCVQLNVGFADDCFQTGAEPGKGMISKREVRLSILSLMEAHPNDIAWDIGAGCGSVSVEWAKLNTRGRIYAIENNQQRIDYLKINSQTFGTSLNLTPVFGNAPESCHNLPEPDVIFIGGNGGCLAGLLEFSWSVLQKGGRLVASAVMPSSIQALKDFATKHSEYQGEFITQQVSKTTNLSAIENVNVLKPISLLKIVKGT